MEYEVEMSDIEEEERSTSPADPNLDSSYDDAVADSATLVEGGHSDDPMKDIATPHSLSNTRPVPKFGECQKVLSRWQKKSRIVYAATIISVHESTSPITYDVLWTGEGTYSYGIPEDFICDFDSGLDEIHKEMARTNAEKNKKRRERNERLMTKPSAVKKARNTRKAKPAPPDSTNDYARTYSSTPRGASRRRGEEAVVQGTDGGRGGEEAIEQIIDSDDKPSSDCSTIPRDDATPSTDAGNYDPTDDSPNGLPSVSIIRSDNSTSGTNSGNYGPTSKPSVIPGSVQVSPPSTAAVMKVGISSGTDQAISVAIPSEAASPRHSMIVVLTSGDQSSASPSGALESPSSSFSSSSLQGLKLRIRLGTSQSGMRIPSSCSGSVPPTPTASSPPSIVGGTSSTHSDRSVLQPPAGADAGLTEQCAAATTPSIVCQEVPAALASSSVPFPPAGQPGPTSGSRQADARASSAAEDREGFMRALMADLGMGDGGQRKRQPRVAAVAGLAARFASQENAQEDSQEESQDEERKERRKDKKDRRDRKRKGGPHSQDEEKNSKKSKNTDKSRDRKRQGGAPARGTQPRKKWQPAAAAVPLAPSIPAGPSDAHNQFLLNQLFRQQSAPRVTPRIDATLLDDGMRDRKKEKQQLVLTATSDPAGGPSGSLGQRPVEDAPSASREHEAAVPTLQRGGVIACAALPHFPSPPQLIKAEPKEEEDSDLQIIGCASGTLCNKERAPGAQPRIRQMHGEAGSAQDVVGVVQQPAVLQPPTCSYAQAGGPAAAAASVAAAAQQSPQHAAGSQTTVKVWLTDYTFHWILQECLATMDGLKLDAFKAEFSRKIKQVFINNGVHNTEVDNKFLLQSVVTPQLGRHTQSLATSFLDARFHELLTERLRDVDEMKASIIKAELYEPLAEITKQFSRTETVPDELVKVIKVIKGMRK